MRGYGYHDWGVYMYLNHYDQSSDIIIDDPIPPALLFYPTSSLRFRRRDDSCLGCIILGKAGLLLRARGLEEA
jgi:hypothetical protein